MKKIIITLAMMLWMTTSAHADINTGLVGYWTLDDGSGTVASDTSGDGNHGTLLNFPSDNSGWVSGKAGQALTLNGTNASINLGSAASLDDIQNQGGGGMTVAFWIKPDSNTTKTIISKGEGNSRSGTWAISKTSSSNPARLTFGKNGATASGKSYNNLLNTGVWQHIVLTWNGSMVFSTGVQVYKNGVLISNTSGADGASGISDASSLLCVGSTAVINGTGCVTTNTADMSLDDLRIYKRVLTTDEITQLYIEAGGTPADTTPTTPTAPTAPTTIPTSSPTTGPILNVKQDGSGDYKTIQLCADNAQPGQTCLVHPGTYDERVSPINSGTQTNPIVFKAAPGTKPKLRAFNTNGKDYITLDGFEITNIGMSLDPVYQGSVLMLGGKGARIINNYIHDTRAACTTFGTSSSFIEIRGNTIDHCGVTKAIIGKPGGPYTITAGINDMVKFKLNGAISYTVTLTPGVGRKSAQICADINAISDFPVVPVVNNAVYCSGVGGDGRIHISARTLGPDTSVELEDIPHNAYETLGLTLGTEVMIGQAAAFQGVSGPSSDVLIEQNRVSRVSDYLIPGKSRFVLRNNIIGPSDPASTIHIDVVQSNGPADFILIEGNQQVGNISSDNHFTLTSAIANYWIIRQNSSFESKGGVGMGAGNFDSGHFAHYNNTWYNNVDYYFAWCNVNLQRSTNNISRNNIWYRTVRNPGGYPYVMDSVSSIDKDYDLVFASGEVKEVHSITADPQFVNGSSGDFTLQAASPAIDAGGSLTTTINSGSSSVTLQVTNACAFQDGWAGINPDWIAVGKTSNVVQITSIDYTTNTITLASPLTWNSSDPVWLYKNSSGQQVIYGQAPDIGANEYNPLASKAGNGDVSADGKTTMYDAALVLRYTMGASLSDVQKQKADINGDGKIDGADVVAIARKALGL